MALAPLYLRRSAAAPSATSAVDPAAPRVVAYAQIVPIDGTIEVRPLAQGRVLRVLVHPGDRVVANQLLAEIESDVETAALRQLDAALAAATAQAEVAREGVRPEEQGALAAAADAAREEAELARDRWRRLRELRTQGFASEQGVLDAQRALDAAAARQREAVARAQAAVAGGRNAEVQAARDQTSAAAAALSQGAVALARTRIVAPIAGAVMSRNVNPGDIIGSNLSSPTLFRLVDPARIEVRLEVEELLAPQVAIGQPVDYMLPGTRTVVAHGTIARIAPQVEKRSIGADDARIRADSQVRPAWSNYQPLPNTAPLPINYRLDAWIHVREPG